ncbi:hypothetical protein SUGI_1063040 [Cryptomeria japonica]|nr:hypothetical protein SUGI_1063040 [Cryptomeria japonica]
MTNLHHAYSSIQQRRHPKKQFSDGEHKARHGLFVHLREVALPDGKKQQRSGIGFEFRDNQRRVEILSELSNNLILHTPHVNPVERLGFVLLSTGVRESGLNKRRLGRDRPVRKRLKCWQLGGPWKHHSKSGAKIMCIVLACLFYFGASEAVMMAN